MYLSSIIAPDVIPELDDVAPPLIHGTAALAHRAYEDHGLDDLLAFIERAAPSAEARAGLILDRSLAHALRFRRAEAEALQRAALDSYPVFRVAGSVAAGSARPLRLLAVMAPGDLMVNVPLDFITRHLDVRLDMLFVVPDQPLPTRVPDHDVAFFAVGEADPSMMRRLASLHAAWPRPVLNDPRALDRLGRDTVAAALASVHGVHSPPAILATREELLAHLGGRVAITLLGRPTLIRPLGSHAGHGLAKIDGPGDLAVYLEDVEAEAFYVTRFVDYRDASGMFRKFRIAFIEGVPFLCHMASSQHWMVHYLNAGMAEHPARRAAEAAAMAEFEQGFAARHAEAFAGLTAWMGLDYFQIDCAETPAGRLLVFEADVAAIVHLMDPADVFPYKPAQMRRVFAAFEAMLRRRAGLD